MVGVTNESTAQEHVTSDWEDAEFAIPQLKKLSPTTIVLSLSSDDHSDEDRASISESDEPRQASSPRSSAPRLSRENDAILATYLEKDIYFEIVEYEDADEDTDDDESAVVHGNESSEESAEAVERGGNGRSSTGKATQPLTLWPQLVCTTSPSVPSPTLAPQPAKDLLRMMAPAPLVTAYDLRPVATSPNFYARGQWGLFLLDEALDRRYAAALVLTGGCHGLPMLPIVVARLILDEALCLAPWLSHFAVVARVDTLSCLHARKIDLSHSRLKPDAADVLGWMMRQSTALQSLDVSGNPLGVRGAAAVGRALQHAPALRSLRLNATQACSAGGTDPSGLQQLALGVRAHPALTKLSLRENAIGACSGGASHKALRALVAAVADPRSTVRSLDVSKNPLGPEGAALLAQALAAQPSLTRLDAASCCLTGTWGKVRDGVRALAAAVAGSTTLETLDLTDNALGRSSEAMDQWHLDERNVTACPVVFWVEALRQNASLQALRLGANHIVGDQEEQLREAWLARGCAAAALSL